MSKVPPERPGYCPVCCSAFLDHYVSWNCPHGCREEYDPLRHHHKNAARVPELRPRQVVMQLERGELRDLVVAAWRLGGVNAAGEVLAHHMRAQDASHGRDGDEGAGPAV